MIYSIKEAFSDLHNLDVREPLRKFQPQRMFVAVNQNNEIVKTQKVKKVSLEALHSFADDCRGTSIFIASAERFKSIDDFRKVVKRNGAIIRKRLNRGND